MSTPNRETCLLAGTTVINANSNGSVITMPAQYNACILYLTAAIPTGTSPTLDIYIQQGFTAQIASDASSLDLTNPALPTIWDDYAHFAQVTYGAAAQSQVMRIQCGQGTSAANAPTASVLGAQSGALAASTVNPGPLGMFWRVLWKVGGTSPAWTGTTLTAQFLNSQG